MTRRLILALGLALPIVAAAQHVWTMDDCIRYALEHSADVQVRELAVKGATADKVRATADFLPSISAQIGGQFSWGRGIDPETNTYTTVTNFSNSEGIYASWTAFDGGRTLYQFRQARVAQRQAKNNLRQERDSKAIDVMQAFVNAIYATGCHTLAQQRLAEVEQELRKARLQEELGTMSRPDVALIEAQRAEAEYEVLRQEGEEERTKRVLMLAMNIDTATPPQPSPQGEGELKLPFGAPSLTPSAFSLTLAGEGDDTPPSPCGEGWGGVLSGVLPAALSATLNLDQARLQKKVATSYLWPTLSFSAGISTGYYTTIGGGAQGRPFREQWRDNMGRYVSANISFPIFGNLSRISQIKKSKYNLASAILQRDETMRKLDHEMMQATADCRQGAKEVEALARKVAADSLAYTLCLRQFEEGLLTAQDLITSSRTLQDTRIKLLQARLTLMMRRRLERYYQTGAITLAPLGNS